MYRSILLIPLATMACSPAKVTVSEDEAVDASFADVDGSEDTGSTIPGENDGDADDLDGDIDADITGDDFDDGDGDDGDGDDGDGDDGDGDDDTKARRVVAKNGNRETRGLVLGESF